jgi:hypothetical protein
MLLKRLAANALLMIGSLVVALLLCEVGAQLTLNPADYLSVTMIPDEILGITIPPKSAGFDDWGFRNPVVPTRVDIVAVGDSHTFGNTARMEDAWPSVLARDASLSVYNLGLGGYGPNQYYQVLTTRGLKLNPSWVFCGLYMGDDFENAFSMTYGLEHWAHLRAGTFNQVDADIWNSTQAVPFNKQVRNWLSRNSFVYQLVVHGQLLAKTKQTVEFARAQRGQDPVTTVVTVENKNISEAFRPAPIASRLDQDSPAVREGMRIAFRLLQDMNDACVKAGCRFAVVIIPTKETVFAEFLEGKREIHLHESIDKVIANERVAHAKLIAFLDAAKIPYVDTLSALRANVAGQLYARTTNDMHPERNGYKVIGDAVSRFMKTAVERP